MPVRKRGNTWWIDLSLGGRRTRISAGKGAKKEEARELEARLRADHHAGRVGRAARHTVSEALARYLSTDAKALRSYDGLLSKAAAWQPLLRRRLLSEAADVASDGKKVWLEAGLALGTINRRLALLRRVCRLAFGEWNWMDKPATITLLDGEQARMVMLTEDQAQHLLNCCSVNIRSAVLLGMHTGLREGELLSLQPKHYEAGRIVLDTKTKTGKPRRVPLTEEAEEVAKTLPLRIRYNDLRKGFEAAREAAGMPWLQFRDLRRSFGSWIVQRTHNLKAAQDLLGHTTSVITSRHYAHLLDEHLEEAVGTLPKFGTIRSQSKPRQKKKKTLKLLNLNNTRGGN